MRKLLSKLWMRLSFDTRLSLTYQKNLVKFYIINTLPILRVPVALWPQTPSFEESPGYRRELMRVQYFEEIRDGYRERYGRDYDEPFVQYFSDIEAAEPIKE